MNQHAGLELLEVTLSKTRVCPLHEGTCADHIALQIESRVTQKNHLHRSCLAVSCGNSFIRKQSEKPPRPVLPVNNGAIVRMKGLWVLPVVFGDLGGQRL